VGVQPAMYVNISSIKPGCHGGYGAIQASVKNGFGPYWYQWLPSYDNRSVVSARATKQYEVEYIFHDYLIDFIDASTSIVLGCLQRKRIN
jgi:hypothetical protein